EQKVMRIEAGVVVGCGEAFIQREQFVQKGCAAAPVADDEHRRFDLDPLQRAAVHSLLKRPQHRERATGKTEAQCEAAGHRRAIAVADRAPCGEVKVEYRPRPGASRTHRRLTGEARLSAPPKRRRISAVSAFVSPAGRSTDVPWVSCGSRAISKSSARPEGKCQTRCQGPELAAIAPTAGRSNASDCARYIEKAGCGAAAAPVLPMSGWPSIHEGCAIPSRASSVGATSVRSPSSFTT